MASWIMFSSTYNVQSTWPLAPGIQVKGVAENLYEAWKGRQTSGWETRVFGLSDQDLDQVMII